MVIHIHFYYYMAWTAPHNGYVKIHVDAATNASKQCSGLGVVIWDSTGS